jgi:hypothetical protein
MTAAVNLSVVNEGTACRHCMRELSDKSIRYVWGAVAHRTRCCNTQKEREMNDRRVGTVAESSDS